MDHRRAVTISKFLSLVLRHQPEVIDLQLDSGGWADVDELLQKCARAGRHFTKQELLGVVETNSKQRFAFSANGKLIRASQGHSIAVDLGYEPIEPPTYLWHGTARRFLGSIFEQGLLKMNRQHVHLSAELSTAYDVGTRHGSPVVFRVRAGDMYVDGYHFFLSANKVWLTDWVPVKYLQKEPDGRKS
jgi:putative RNA 2'-phosphotransferase